MLFRSNVNHPLLLGFSIMPAPCKHLYTLVVDAVCLAFLAGLDFPPPSHEQNQG